MSTTATSDAATTGSHSRCDTLPSLFMGDSSLHTYSTLDETKPSDVSSSYRSSISSSTISTGNTNTNGTEPSRKFTRSFSRRVSNLSKSDGTALPLSPEFELRRKENLSDKLQLLPCGNLRFERLQQLGVVGREEEKEILKGVFDRTSKRTRSRTNHGGDSAEEEVGTAAGNSNGTDLGKGGSNEEAACIADDAPENDNSNHLSPKGPIHEINSSPKELILISGLSGSGKTRLATSFIPHVSRLGGIFVQGKYDLCFQEQQPYHGILMACAEICGKILLLREENDYQQIGNSNNQPSKFDQLRELLVQQLGDELPILVNLLQPLADVVGEEYCQQGIQTGLDVEGRDKQISDTKNLNMEQTKEQFNYTFRKFIRVLTSNPLSHSLLGLFVVILLDDLQWADAASLELIDLLLTDRESDNLIIVGCYRSEEVEGDENADSKLSLAMDHWSAKMNVYHDGITDNQHGSSGNQISNRWSANLTKIQLSNLSVGDVNHILMELFSIDDPHQTLPLAGLCHNRSFGNPFHLIIFLRMLEDNQLLQFNIGSFAWRWDLQQIQEKTCVEENVVGLLTISLREISEDLKWVLILAACLGSSFDINTLFLVWCEFPHVNGDSANGEPSRHQLEVLLEQAVNGHYLEHDSINRDESAKPNSFRWVHDKVIEAVMELEKETQSELQFRIGLILLGKLPEDQLGDFVFVVANLLCCGNATLDMATRDRVVQIYIQSGIKAISCSAFKSASRYVQHGVQLFSSPYLAFKENYDLSLELWSLGAEIEGSLGNEEIMQQYFKVVDEYARNSLDKVRCHKAIISRLVNNDTKLACVTCLEVLKEFGCKLPRNSLAQTTKALKSLQRMKTVDPQLLHSLPLMTDETVKVSMKLLNHVCECSILLGNTFLLILACCEMYERTVKYGLSPVSTSALSFLATIKCATGDFSAARDFCDHALSLLPKFQIKSEQSRTHFIAYYMVKPWTMPLRNCQKFLIEGYNIGLEGGDTDSGCWNIAMYIYQCFCSGMPLQSILSDIEKYLPQFVEFGRMEQALHVRIHHQAILSLVGLSKSSEPTDMYLDELMDEFKKSTSNVPDLLLDFHRSNLCSIFCNHERGAKLAERGDEFFKKTAGNAPAMTETFQRGVSLFDMARKTKKRKYKKAAKRVRSTMAAWVKANNPNVVHCVKLLDAEHFALRGDRERARQAYESSISLSIRSGMVQDAALALERYGDFLLKELNNEEQALRYFKRAIQYYSEWGAMAKVHHLNEKYSNLWNVPTSITVLANPLASMKKSYS